MNHSPAGLILGPSPHHLDHIGTLCALLDIPLIVTDGEIAEQAYRFYPQLVTLHIPTIEVSKYIVASHNVVISSQTSSVIEQTFGIEKSLQDEKLLPVWCPHGNSDKGHTAMLMEALENEKNRSHLRRKNAPFHQRKRSLLRKVSLPSHRQLPEALLRKNETVFAKNRERDDPIW